MQNKSIFIDEVKIFDVITISKNQIHKIEKEYSDQIKTIYEDFQNRNNELINIFNQEEVKITDDYLADNQNIKDKNATYKKMYSIIEDNYFKDTEILVLELKEAFNILKVEEVNRFEQIKNNMSDNKINDIDVINKDIQEENIKINNQLKSLESEYKKMIDDNNKSLNNKITNLTPILDSELLKVTNIFEKNKIENDMTYSSEISNINNTYIKEKTINDNDIEEYNKLEKILQLQLEKNFNTIQSKKEEYASNLDLNNTIKEVTNNIINVTTKFNSDSKIIADKLSKTQEISINNNLFENNLEQQLILLNNINNDIESKSLDNKEFKIYLNKLNEINDEFMKASIQLKEDIVLISDKQIEKLMANIINSPTEIITTNTNKVLKIDAEFQIVKDTYINNINNEMKLLAELQLKLTEINDYISKLNNNYNINNKTSDELEKLIIKSKKEALEEATKISNDFLHTGQNKYEQNKNNLIKVKEENISILNAKLEELKNNSNRIELLETQEANTINMNEINEYNNMILFYNQQIEDINKQIVENKETVTNLIVESIDKELLDYKYEIDSQKEIISNNLNLTLNELKLTKDNEINNYNSEIVKLEENNKILSSIIEKNTNELVHISENMNESNTKFELSIKNNSIRLDNEKIEETNNLTEELTVIKKELESYDLLTDSLINSKEPYIAQLLINKDQSKIMSILLKIQEIDTTLYKINKDKNDMLIKKESNEEGLTNITKKYFTMENNLYLSSSEDFEKDKLQSKNNEELYNGELIASKNTLLNNSNKIDDLTNKIKQIELISGKEQGEIILESELKLTNKDDEYNNVRDKKLEDATINRLNDINNEYNTKLISVINSLDTVISSINIDDKHIVSEKLTNEIEVLESKLIDNKLSIQDLEEKLVLVENEFNLKMKENDEFNIIDIKNSKEILEQHYKVLETDILLKYDINFVKDNISEKDDELNEYNSKKDIINNRVAQLNDNFQEQEDVYNNKVMLLNDEINSLNNKIKYNLDELKNNRDTILENNYQEYLPVLTDDYNNRKNELSLTYKNTIDIENKLLRENEENNNNIQRLSSELLALQTTNKKEIDETLLKISEEQKQINLSYSNQIINTKRELSTLEDEKQLLVNNKAKELEANEIIRFEKEYEFTFNILENQESKNKETELLSTQQNNIKLATDIYNNNISKLSEDYQKDIKNLKNNSNVEVSKINEIYNIEKNKQLLNYETNKNALENEIKTNDSNSLLKKSDIESKYNNMLDGQNNISIASLKEIDNNLNIKKQEKLLELEKDFQDKINEYYINYDEELNLLNNKKDKHINENKTKLEDNMDANKISFENNKSNNVKSLISDIEKEKANALNLMKEL